MEIGQHADSGKRPFWEGEWYPAGEKLGEWHGTFKVAILTDCHHGLKSHEEAGEVDRTCLSTTHLFCSTDKLSCCYLPSVVLLW